MHVINNRCLASILWSKYKYACTRMWTHIKTLQQIKWIDIHIFKKRAKQIVSNASMSLMWVVLLEQEQSEGLQSLPGRISHVYKLYV